MVVDQTTPGIFDGFLEKVLKKLDIRRFELFYEHSLLNIFQCCILAEVRSSIKLRGSIIL